MLCIMTPSDLLRHQQLVDSSCTTFGAQSHECLEAQLVQQFGIRIWNDEHSPVPTLMFVLGVFVGVVCMVVMKWIKLRSKLLPPASQETPSPAGTHQ